MGPEDVGWLQEQPLAPAFLRNALDGEITMAQPTNIPDYRSMSIAERILLVEEIWESIVAEEQSVKLTPEERDELDRRLAAHEAAPNEGSSWEEVKARLERKS